MQYNCRNIFFSLFIAVDVVNMRNCVADEFIGNSPERKKSINLQNISSGWQLFKKHTDLCSEHFCAVGSNYECGTNWMLDVRVYVSFVHISFYFPILKDKITYERYFSHGMRQKCTRN